MLMRLSHEAPYLECHKIALEPEHSFDFRRIFELAFDKDYLPGSEEIAEDLGAVFCHNDPEYHPNNRVVGIVDEYNQLLAAACLSKVIVDRVGADGCLRKTKQCQPAIAVHFRNFCRDPLNPKSKGIGPLLIGAMYNSSLQTAARGGVDCDDLMFCLDVDRSNAALFPYYYCLGFRAINATAGSPEKSLQLVKPEMLERAYLKAKSNFPELADYY